MTFFYDNIKYFQLNIRLYKNPGDDMDSTGRMTVKAACRAQSVKRVNTTGNFKNANDNYSLAA